MLFNSIAWTHSNTLISIEQGILLYTKMKPDLKLWTLPTTQKTAQFH